MQRTSDKMPAQVVRLAIACALVLLISAFTLWNHPFGRGRHVHPTKLRFWTTAADNDFFVEKMKVEKPPEISKIMGLIFYGRRSRTSILDCYLKRNLVKNGGMLDGVIWVERTTDVADRLFLDRLIESEPEYERWEIDFEGTRNYSTSYERIEDDVMYIKMDDDIVFMEDTTIPSLVHTKIEHPEYFSVSANIVNQPMISWIHWNLGAVRPYLPEVGRRYVQPGRGNLTDWRASSLPEWEGPEDFDPLDWTSPGGETHRWLPVTGREDHVLSDTPIAKTEYDPLGNGWHKWQIAAQQHYSFFESLEKNELWRYRFHTWDFQYARMGIQFIAIMGSDINIAKPIEADDEEQLSVTVPKKLGRQCVADGRGVAAHYSFYKQINKGGIGTTDILERYRAFAIENICASPMLWTSEEDDETIAGVLYKGQYVE